MTNRFSITWSTAKQTEVEIDESISADAYAMARWGVDSAAQVLADYGVKIELLHDADKEVEIPLEDPLSTEPPMEIADTTEVTTPTTKSEEHTPESPQT